MFAKKKPNHEVEELNAEITRVLSVLARIEPDSEEYTTASDNLATLYAQKKEIPSDRISKDQLVAVSGNLLGILAIVMYEQKHVFTSKAGNFVGKFTR